MPRKEKRTVVKLIHSVIRQINDTAMGITRTMYVNILELMT